MIKNNEIKARRVMVISEEGNLLGEFSKDEAINLAEENDLDLVQMNSESIPTCKIMDHGKYMFEQNKKSKAVKNKDKEIQFEPNIATNDLNHKLKHAMEFIDKGYTVSIRMILKGRMRESTTIGEEFLSRVNSILNENNLQLTYKRNGNLFSGTIEKEKKDANKN